MLMIYKVYQYNAVTIKCTQCSQCLQSMYNLHLPSLSPPALNLGSDQSTSPSSLRSFPAFPHWTWSLAFHIVDFAHVRLHNHCLITPYYKLD